MEFQESFVVSIMDYGASNVRSIRNAIKLLGYKMNDIVEPADILKAKVIIFPGQGNFSQAMKSLEEKGWIPALKEYLAADRPFFGICLGMQVLFEGSEESEGVSGLGLIPGMVRKFNPAAGGVRVPQIGWNGLTKLKPCSATENINDDELVYFVHSYCAIPTEKNLDWVHTVTDYGETKYISIIHQGNVIAAQFHPEKSGPVGLEIIRSFLSNVGKSTGVGITTLGGLSGLQGVKKTVFARRVIACLDVRSNDAGDLVVTKGDQYDVREAADSETGRGGVRNLGKPVSLCKRYYDEGADEVVFLNITSFRQGVIDDMPMLQVLEQSSENVFVPLTVGGGIRGYTDEKGVTYSALEVAARYFRAGADKVSIGSDAVYAAEEYLKDKGKNGNSAIEQISSHYGAQAVVVSIDPKRVYLPEPPKTHLNNIGVEEKTIVELPEGQFGPKGEKFCWWQVTVKGGRETRDLDAVQLAKICQILGAGEIMLNCIDMDGQGQGYDIPLINLVQNSVTIPVIASSGAGLVTHFSEVFQRTPVPAALAAGIFHRREVEIKDVKTHLRESNIPSRLCHR